MNERKDDRKNPGIKREYYPLPVSEPAGWRCIEIHIPDGPEYHELLITVLKSLTLWLNYQRDATHRGKHIADLFAYALSLPELGCDMNCEELALCLQPFFDDLNARLDAAASTIAPLIEQTTTALAANGTQGISVLKPCSNSGAIYAGCLAVVRKINAILEAAYIAAENSPAENLLEQFADLLDTLPLIQELPFDEMFNMVEILFNNQASAYLAAYLLDNFEQVAACDLYCRIGFNGCILSHDVLGQWLEDLPGEVPGNLAGEVFGRFAPARITLVQKIAAFFNGNSSIEEFFKLLELEFRAGATGSVAVPALCEDCIPEGPFCYDNESDPQFKLITGTVITDAGVDFVRAIAGNTYAEFELDFGGPVTNAAGGYFSVQQVVGGGTGPDGGDVRLFNGNDLVLVAASRSGADDGGFTWQTQGVDNSPVVFTRARFRYLWANGAGDVRGQICLAAM